MKKTGAREKTIISDRAQDLEKRYNEDGIMDASFFKHDKIHS